MTSSFHKLIVGFFALTCLSLLGIMVILFGGGTTLFKDTYNVSVHFPEVENVQAGQSVTLNGKRIGATKAVEFWNPVDLDQGIRVIVSIDSEFELPANSEVLVAASVMGFGHPTIAIVVEQTPDEARLPRDGTAVIEGRMVPTLERLLPPEMQETLIRTADGLSELSDALEPVADNLAQLLEPRSMEAVDIQQATANLATLVERFDLALKNVNITLGDPKNIENFRNMLENVSDMSRHGVEVMANLKVMSDDGKQVVVDAARMLRTMTTAADRISSLLEEMDKTAAALNERRGTVGSLLNDNRLYEELLLSARRMTTTLDDLREVLDLIKRHGVLYRGQ